MAIGIVIFFIFLIAYFRKKNTKAQNEIEATFWERETEANHVRRQDISGLPYISIPLENFPLNMYENSEIKECESLLKSLSEKKILNLGNQTNTDLKLQYGMANLQILSECEENFITLCRVLVAYAEALLACGSPREAQTVLEFGISCGSDISKNYLLLADLYLADHDSGAYDALISKAGLLDSPMKVSIVTRLKEKAPA